jgi:hypothetical protein
MFDLWPRMSSSQLRPQGIPAEFCVSYCTSFQVGSYVQHKWVVQQLLKIESTLPRRPGARTEDLKVPS